MNPIVTEEYRELPPPETYTLEPMTDADWLAAVQDSSSLDDPETAFRLAAALETQANYAYEEAR